jgi:hypothetical protein
MTPAKLALHPRGRRDKRGPVGNVGLDRQRTLPELVRERLDALGAAREQSDTVPVSDQRPSARLADPRGRAGDDCHTAAAAAVVGAHVRGSLWVGVCHAATHCATRPQQPPNSARFTFLDPAAVDRHDRQVPRYAGPTAAPNGKTGR